MKYIFLAMITVGFTLFVISDSLMSIGVEVKQIGCCSVINEKTWIYWTGFIMKWSSLASLAGGIAGIIMKYVNTYVGES